MIRVLIVDDSAIIRNLLIKTLQASSSFLIVGEARNGQKALDLARVLTPDVIIMDLAMPLMDGLEATKRIMKESPCAIILFTSEENLDLAYQALEYGAIEIIQKPDLSILTSSFYTEFLKKITIIAEAHANLLKAGFSKTNDTVLVSETKEIIGIPTIEEKNQFEIVGIASSTGGPLAIQKILQELDPQFPLPILIVQHIENKFDTAFVNWLSQTSSLPVSLAEHNKKIENGHVYIAPANFHMIVKKSGDENEYYIVLNQEPEKHFLRPAADPLFFSLAHIFGNRSIAIVLTGMGSDGAEGLLVLKEKGAVTLAESQESCVVFGMPKAAIQKGAIQEVLPLSGISKRVTSLVSGVQ